MLPDQEELTVIDLFAGIGGFRIGFERAGYKTIYSNDFDKSCKISFDGYFGEGALDMRDIRDIDPHELPDADIITGGFPCQPFSKIGKLHGFADARGTLFWDLLQVLRVKQPRAFVLENVAHLLKHDKGYTFERIRDGLENQLNYHVYYKVLNTKDFGLPQDRKRIYMVGFREPTEFEFPEPIPLEMRVGDVLEKDDVHDFFYLSQKYFDGLQKHKLRHQEKGHGFGYKVLLPDGIATALVVGNMGRERNLIQDKPRPEGSVNRVGSVLNRQGIRKVTIRECARLQGFPDSYQFPVPVTVGYKQLGNAVSVPVAEAVARQVRRALLPAATPVTKIRVVPVAPAAAA